MSDLTSQRYDVSSRGEGLLLVATFIWFVGVLFGGIVTALGLWVSGHLR